MGLKCSKCGGPIEGDPQHCGRPMTLNADEVQLECWMGPKCGFMKLGELICQKCGGPDCT